jgi:PAS domain S-box-containing protein
MSTLLSPSIAIASWILAGYARWNHVGGIWFSWWLGDMTSALVITPLVLVWSGKSDARLTVKQWLEAGLLTVFLLVSCNIAFNASFTRQVGGAPLAFLIIPFLLWSALRFGQRTTVTAVFVVAGLAIAGTIRGEGTFASADPRQSLLLVQNYVAVIAVMSLILVADVTQRRQCDLSLGASEQRYRQLFEDNPQPMWVFDYETLRVLAVNNAAIRHYGYSREEFLSMAITDVHPPQDCPALLEAASQARQGVELRPQWQHLKKDGTLIDVELARHNLIFDGKQAAMVLSTDVTERKRAEREVLQSKIELEHRVRERTAQLEAINKELEAFSYSVSHDLRAPLRSVRGFSEVLLERYSDKLDTRGREFLRRTVESSQHMDLLIEDLLKLSRVGRSELKHQQVDLSFLAKGIAAELQSAEPKRHVKLIIAAGLTAQGDERLLRIVLENLLRNAWKFTGQRSKGIIEFGSVSEPEPAFFVRDNGAGFDNTYAGRLFGVFQRLHSATEFPGTGIGLATVQRIVNRHGGRAWAQGEIDKGATFYFTLPSSCSL